MMMFFPFITAACRKRCCRNEALLTQFWSRSSYFHGIGFSQRPSSRLPVHDDVFAIHHRSVSKTVLSIRSCTYTILVSAVVFVWYRVLSGTIKQVTHRRRCFCNSLPPRIENGVVDTNLHLQNSGLGRRISMV